MKAPKMTNYEQLKRPKTNRDDAMRPGAIKYAQQQVNQTGFRLNSQRENLQHLEGVISAEQDIQVRKKDDKNPINLTNQRDLSQGRTLQQRGQVASALDHDQISIAAVTHQGFNQHPGSKHHRWPRLASQGASTRPQVYQNTTVPTTPSQVSKKYAGGFGGAGSVFTHSHLINSRKHSHYRVTTQGPPSSTNPHWPKQVTMEQKQKILTHQREFSRGGAAPGHGYNSSVDSSDLMVSGNRTGQHLKEYFNNGPMQQPVQNKRNSIKNQQHLPDLSVNNQSRLGVNSRNNRHTGPISSDTSRSPIPIDPESYKSMHRHLPKRMDASSNELAKGYSREPSPNSVSGGGSHNNSDINQQMVTHAVVQPFIMSPQNLQETLKKHQEVIRAEAAQRAVVSGQTSLNESQMQTNIIRGGGSKIPISNGVNNAEINKSGTTSQTGARNVFTQHGKRTKVSQGKLKEMSIGAQNFSSGKVLSIDTSQNLTAKQLGAGSSDPYNSQNINQETSMYKPQISGTGILPALKGTNEQIQAQPNVSQLLKDQDEDGKQSVFIGQTGPQSSINQNIGSNASLIGTEKPSDVAIRVNKINIAIKADKDGVNLGTSDHGKASVNDSREQMNFSNLTNYNNRQAQPMFVEESEPGVNYSKEGQSKDSSTPSKATYGRRKFKPVLKSKSYLNNEGVNSTPHSPKQRDNQQLNITANNQNNGLQAANNSSVSDKQTTNQSNAAVQHVIQSRSGIGMLDEIQIATTSRQSPNSSNKDHRQSNFQRSGSDFTPWRHKTGAGAGTSNQATTNANGGVQTPIKRDTGTAINQQEMLITASNAIVQQQQLQLQQQSQQSYYEDDATRHSRSIHEEMNKQSLIPTYVRPNDSIGYNATVSDSADLGQDVSFYRDDQRITDPNYEEGETTDQTNSLDQQQLILNDRALRKMLRIDEKAWLKCRPRDFGALDFVSLKTHEFLVMQKMLSQMDYNSLQSERSSYLDNKVDHLMKSIALNHKKHHQKLTNQDGSELFDLNQRKSMHINSQVPIGMIRFKNKSEQTRYVRVANCILALNDFNIQKSQNDIQFTYMKIFRFLADILSADEFESLSYYHVSRFIGKILKLAFEQLSTDSYNSPSRRKSQTQQQPLEKISLRRFMCDALDLTYMRTKQSEELLVRAHAVNSPTGQDNSSFQTEIRQLWSKLTALRDVDLNEIYSGRSIISNKPTLLKSSKGNAEARHQHIQEQISSQVQSYAHEPRLQNVIRSTYFKEKETIKRENLARLFKNNRKQNDLDYHNLSKESTIARNQIVLEHVVASRNMREWRDQVCTEIHKERQENQRRKAKSQAIVKRITQVQSQTANHYYQPHDY